MQCSCINQCDDFQASQVSQAWVLELKVSVDKSHVVKVRLAANSIPSHIRAFEHLYQPPPPPPPPPPPEDPPPPEPPLLLGGVLDDCTLLLSELFIWEEKAP